MGTSYIQIMPKYVGDECYESTRCILLNIIHECVYSYVHTSHMQSIIHTCDLLQRIVMCMHALYCLHCALHSI